MRSAGTYLLSVILIAGALSAVVSMATIKWLYPPRSPDRLPAATTTAAAAADAETPHPTQTQTASPAETLALNFMQRAATGDLDGAAALAVGLTPEMLTEQITRHRAVPERAASLPGPAGSTTVLVWSSTGNSRSLYHVTVEKSKVTALKGPMAPEGGYAPLAITLLDEQARPLEMAPYRGRALLLIAPRAPEPGLTELLNDLRTTYAAQGIDVVLVLDIKSSDWLAAARAGGYQGPVWRVKARLDDIPLVARGTLLGAFGVLLDRDHVPVASLAALAPLNYGLPDETPAAIAPAVFRAYGLLP